MPEFEDERPAKQPRVDEASGNKSGGRRKRGRGGKGNAANKTAAAFAAPQLEQLLFNQHQIMQMLQQIMSQMQYGLGGGYSHSGAAPAAAAANGYTPY